MTDSAGTSLEPIGAAGNRGVIALRLLAMLTRILPSGRGMVILVPYIWLLLFFLVPFAIVLKIALAEPLVAQPPYSPLLQWRTAIRLEISLVFENFQFILSDNLYIIAYLNSAKIAAVATIFTLLVGFPLAYAIARAPLRYRTLLLMGIILPFWTSFLIRVYAWIGILKNDGMLNGVLRSGSGMIDEPLVDPATPISRSISASSTPTCPSWCCRSTPTWCGWTESLLEAAMPISAARPCRSAFLENHRTAGEARHRRRLRCWCSSRPIGEFVIPDLLGGSGYADDRADALGPSSSATATGRWRRRSRSRCC